MMTISELMTSRVTTLSPDEDLMKADAIMKRGRVRHLPVVQDGRFLGLVTHRDLLRAQISALGQDAGGSCTTLTALPARDFMTTNVLTTSRDAEPAEVARLMLQHQLGCVPVVDDKGELLGIVTEADFVRWALETASRAAA